MAMSDGVRGFERRALALDFNLYRRRVAIAGQRGAELSVIDMRPEGIEQTILLQHGYAGCAETWEHQIEALSSRYRVVAPDLRGHGQSDAPYTRYTMDELTADLQRIVQALELPERFVLAGHSFGGAVALEYADRHPERIERLILVATPGAFPLPRSVGLLSRIPTPVYRLFWRYRPRWNAQPHVLKRMLLDNMRRWQGWPLLERLERPTLLVTGARDTYFPREVYERVAEALPEAERVDVGASKHKVQLERHQAVTRAIERFVHGGPARSWRDEPIDAALARRRPWLGHYAAGCPPTVPLPQQPLDAFLASTAARLPRRAAIRHAGRATSYEQLDRRANQLARALQGLGLMPGDRVALRLAGSPELPMAFFGTLRAGCVAVLPPPGAAAPDLADCLARTGSRAILVDAGDAAAAEAAAAAGIERRIRVGEPVGAPGRSGTQGLDDLLVDVEERALDLRVPPPSLAAILHTSGQSGPPRAVQLSHQNLVANAIQLRHWLPELRYGRDRLLPAVPLGQAYGLTLGLCLPVLVGATILLAPEAEPEGLLALLRRERPSLLVGSPMLYAALLEQPGLRRARLDRLTACLCGGAPLPVELHESFERLTRARLIEGYGLTEAGPVSHANPVSDRRRAGSIGLPLPNTDARIVDPETGTELPPGQVGELQLRGPQIAIGYWAAPDEGSTDRSATRFAEGWLHTGDLAQMDPGGFFRLLGRMREAIQTASGAVHPRDVAEVLLESSAVADAAALAGPEPAGQQTVLALVAPQPAATIDPALLLAHCRRRLPPAAWPREVRILERLPRDPSGKLPASALRAAWSQALPAGATQPPEPLPRR